MTLKNALKRYRTVINLRTLRDAEGTLDVQNAWGTQGDGVRKNGDGTVT